MRKIKAYCEECETETEHYRCKGFPGDQYQPAEPAGMECAECGDFTRMSEWAYQAEYGDE